MRTTIKIDPLDGSLVENGLKFRNEFHLDSRSTALIFVPCGGRPEAVDLSNVHDLINEDGTPRFKYIVEGANLFFTQVIMHACRKAQCSDKDIRKRDYVSKKPVQ